MAFHLSFDNGGADKKIHLLIVLLLVTSAQSQKLCKLSTSTGVQPSNNTVFIQNFSAGKCLKMEAFGILPESKVVLDECSYWDKASKDQQYFISNNDLNKTTIRTDAGRGNYYCLTSKNGKPITNSACEPKSFDQSWIVKPVQGHPGQFLVEQYSSKKCLKPKTRSTGSEIQLVPCNAYETEQIWKICA